MKIRSLLAHWVMKQWLRTGWFSLLMTPLAYLTAAFVARKQAAYASGRRPAHHPGVPVIVVGNILVGGTGKTPVVIAVTQHLQSLGLNPGVLSRGYGTRASGDPQVGTDDLDPARFGDEPALISRQTGAPVAVHPSRVRAAMALLAAFPEVNVLVSDDGLQHLALARDIEIVVQDERGIGNGRLLPAGPLREPATRLQQVAAIITNHRNRRSDGTDPGTMDGQAHDSPQVHALSPRPDARPLRVRMHIVAAPTRELEGSGTRTLAQWAKQSADIRISAAAGIGLPESFFSMLEQAGIALHHRISLPDHFDYRSSPFAGLDTDIILVTSKDGIKCRHLDDGRLWEVPINATFEPPDFPGVLLNGLAPPPSVSAANVLDSGKLL